jgi:hypothetical protein
LINFAENNPFPRIEDSAKEARQLKKQLKESNFIGQERSVPILVEEKSTRKASDYFIGDFEANTTRNIFS